MTRLVHDTPAQRQQEHGGTALMKAKMPPHMHREVIVFNSRRWQAAELVQHHVVDHSCPPEQVTEQAALLAERLAPKGRGAARKVMQSIKRRVYKDCIDALAAAGDGPDSVMSLSGRTKGVAYAAPAKL
eukprot:gene21411-11216_t